MKKHSEASMARRSWEIYSPDWRRIKISGAHVKSYENQGYSTHLRRALRH